jgi:hypothetical protein
LWPVWVLNATFRNEGLMTFTWFFSSRNSVIYSVL